MYQQHPLSAAFPSMGDDEFQALKDSIVDLGVQNPVTLFEGMVLDGWHRYCAAIELGMECPERDLESWVDPRSYVLAQNKARRHLTIAQMSMAAAAVYEWRGVGRPSGNAALNAELRQSEVAEQAGVSVRSLRQADAVMSEAVPAVVAAVKSGEMGLAKASAIAKLPQEQQADAIHKPMREIVSVPKKGANTAADTALDIDDSGGIDPAPAQAAPAVEPLAPEYTELNAARDQIADLQASLALATMGDVPEADRTQAAELIEHLRDEVRGLTAQLRAVTGSRDFLMQENAQMKQQLASQRRELDRLKSLVTC